MLNLIHRRYQTTQLRMSSPGRTSMEIGVRVEAENFITGEVRHTSSAYLTFVALDEKGKPKTIPHLILETDEEMRRNQKALMRKKTRLDLKTREDKCKKDGICDI